MLKAFHNDIYISVFSQRNFPCLSLYLSKHTTLSMYIVKSCRRIIYTLVYKYTYNTLKVLKKNRLLLISSLLCGLYYIETLYFPNIGYMPEYTYIHAPKNDFFLVFFFMLAYGPLHNSHLRNARAATHTYFVQARCFCCLIRNEICYTGDAKSEAAAVHNALFLHKFARQGFRALNVFPISVQQRVTYARIYWAHCIYLY